MPTWGWFVVALVVIDLAVVVTWFALRHRTAAARTETVDRHPVDAETHTAVAALVHARKPAQAMSLLRDRTGMPLRQAKNVVDAVEAADRPHAGQSRSA